MGNALARIVKEEGVGGLFTGAGPTVVRAMALNMGMLASNDQVREGGISQCSAAVPASLPATQLAACVALGSLMLVPNSSPTTPPWLGHGCTA